MPDENTGPENPDGGRASHVSTGKERNSRRTAWLAALVSTAVVLAAAGVALGLTANNKVRVYVAGPRSTTTTAQPSPACPLSGLPSGAGGVPQRPAIAIKVDNYPTARPQSGLDHADIVFEEPVEGGITRLVAVFQCQNASLVGPVRSARAVDASILDELSRPIFVHVGGIPPVLALISEANDDNEDLGTNASLIQNPTGRYAPYDTYTSTAALWRSRPGDRTPPSPVFSYSENTPSGRAVTSVHIPFSPTSNVTWSWSSHNGLWMLSYSGVPATVANGSQIGVPNIVVETVHVTYGPWVENAEGGLEVQSQLTGSGPLEVFRNGIAVTGTWERPALDQPTSLVTSDGSPIALQPGEAWVEIVPSSVSVTTTAPSNAAG